MSIHKIFIHFSQASNVFGFVDGWRRCLIVANRFYQPTPAFIAASHSDDWLKHQVSFMLDKFSTNDLKDLAKLISHRDTFRSYHSTDDHHEREKLIKELKNSLSMVYRLTVYEFDIDYADRFSDRNDTLYIAPWGNHFADGQPVQDFTHTLASTLAETTQHFKKRRQGKAESTLSPLQFNSLHPAKKAFEQVGTLPLKITRNHLSSPDTIAGKPIEQLAVELDKLDVTYEIPWGSGLSNKQHIKNLLNKGFRRWRALMNHKPAVTLLFDYFNQVDPRIRSTLDTRYVNRSTFYEYRLSIEVILALGLAGNQKLGANKLPVSEGKHYVGPFSFKALDEIADLTDHINREAEQKAREEYLLTRSQSTIGFPKTYWVEIKVEYPGSLREPVTGQAWWIKTPDGAVHTGVTSAKGTARVAGIAEDGPCYIKFPGASDILLNGNEPPPPTDTTAGTYVVQQGDTLARIAKANGIGLAKDIYNHPANAKFRRKRPNPNIMYPGDQIVMPEPSDEPFRLRMNTVHEFYKGPEKEKLVLKLIGMANKRAILTAGGSSIDKKVDENGHLQVEVDTDVNEAELKIFLDENSSQPTYIYPLKLAHLDPIDTVAGVQGRCNNLGFDCGVVDGVMGEKTKSGISAFQQHHKLTVDGIAGPETQAKLEEIYGC